MLALAAIYDGATRTEAAKIGGVGLQVIRDWVLKFNAHGRDGLIDRKACQDAKPTSATPNGTETATEIDGLLRVTSDARPKR